MPIVIELSKILRRRRLASQAPVDVAHAVLFLASAQQKTLPWMRNNELENPSGMLGVLARMAGEVLLFRSLFRNTRVEIDPAKEKVSYVATKYLWAAAMAFHCPERRPAMRLGTIPCSAAATDGCG